PAGSPDSQHTHGMTQTLAGLLARRDRLTAGEVVTVGVQIARELTVLHTRGRAHGAVTASAIKLDGDGRPELSEPRPSGGDPSDDVRELAVVLRRAVGPGAPVALLAVIDRALEFTDCPSAAARLARELYAACPPEPLRLPLSLPAGARRLSGPRLVLGVTLVLIGAGFVGVAWARSGPPGEATVATVLSPSPASGSPNWATVMARLDATRDAAFVGGDVAALGKVYTAGSAVLATETATLRQLLTHHVHARALHLVIVSVRAITTTPTRVTLSVVDRLPAYDVMKDSNGVAAHRPGRGPRTWSVVLRAFGGEWRISAVSSCSGGSTPRRC
ncbi:MAG TPA: hypothetical protein VKJ07_00950, partial [Mycobacteriales bacterium]|nr:hypothetical protein [Mycobacteriales bacterium]